MVSIRGYILILYATLYRRQ